VQAKHQFCKAEHISESLGISLVDARSIVDGVIAANNATLSADFANKRADLKNKVLREKEDAPSASKLLGAQISFELVKGKRLFGLLAAELQKLGRNPMHLLTKKTVALEIEAMKAFSDVAWPSETVSLSKTTAD
jgi:hypothetical protein